MRDGASRPNQLLIELAHRAIELIDGVVVEKQLAVWREREGARRAVGMRRIRRSLRRTTPWTALDPPLQAPRCCAHRCEAAPAFAALPPAGRLGAGSPAAAAFTSSARPVSMPVQSTPMSGAVS